MSRLENTLVQAIGDLEKRRLELVAELTRAVTPGAMRSRCVCVTWPSGLPEPSRGRLLVLREQLRERIVESERRIIGDPRRATESLLKHMQGPGSHTGQRM